MRAAVLYNVNEPFKVETVDLKEPQQGEVRVKLAASGVCHTDLSIQRGLLPMPPPIIIGHEGAGVVDRVGPGVTSVRKGDHVILTWLYSCGHCRDCSRGKPYLCDAAAMATMSPLEARRFSQHGQAVMRSLEELPFPVLAAVNGFALGGGLELALACDFIFAAEQAKFGQPEITLGIIPGFGGTQRLQRRIGVARARQWIYSGEIVDAAEAARVGLVNRVLPRAELLAETIRVATELASKAPMAIQQAKAAINAGADMAREDGCRYEAESFALTFSTEDQREGMQAFLGKRKAQFTGR